MGSVLFLPPRSDHHHNLSSEASSQYTVCFQRYQSFFEKVGPQMMLRHHCFKSSCFAVKLDILSPSALLAIWASAVHSLTAAISRSIITSQSPCHVTTVLRSDWLWQHSSRCCEKAGELVKTVFFLMPLLSLPNPLRKIGLAGETRLTGHLTSNNCIPDCVQTSL